MARAVTEDPVLPATAGNGELTGPILLPGSKPVAPGRFLGLESGAWTKMLFTLMIASVIAVGSWAMLVRDDLKELNRDQFHHEKHGHDATNATIDEIKDVQTIQGYQLKSIGEGIDDIKAELEELKE